jgi:hypothetical protein
MTTDQETFHLPHATSRITAHDKPLEENNTAPTSTLLEAPNITPPVTAQPLFAQRILPRDFYSSARVNHAACFGEAMQVIQDDRIVDPVPKGTEERDRIDQLNREVMGWAAGWDGVAYWPVTLDCSFASAVEEDREEQWQEQLWGHASKGRCLLAQLYSMGGRLPKERYKVRELWRQQVGLMEILIMGIMTINIYCSVLPHHWNAKRQPPPAYSSEFDAESSGGDSAINSADADDKDSEYGLG